MLSNASLANCPFCGSKAKDEVSFRLSCVRIVIHCKKCTCALTEELEGTDFTFEQLYTSMDRLKANWNHRQHINLED